MKEFYSPFSIDKIFGSIEHAFSYKWKGIGHVHPHNEKEAETTIHWDRLAAKNDPIVVKECSQHHGHKGDPEVMPGTCGAIGERAQVILVWIRAPGCWERLPPTKTRSHEG